MAKIRTIVGYGFTKEKTPGVWKMHKIERIYIGDTQRLSRSLQGADKLNDDISLNMQLSIVADPYAYENFMYIRYAEVSGVKWRVTAVEVQYPRLTLTLGEVYNDDESD